MTTQELEQELNQIQELLDTKEACEQEAKAVTPEEALNLLQEGNKRYLKDALNRPNQTIERRLTVATGQKPFATILGCADSRVPPELLFDYGLGDLFIVRVAGNVADTAVLGSVEFSAGALEVPLVVVLGHGECGAVKAAINVVKCKAEVPGNVGELVKKITPAVEKVIDDPGDTLANAIRSNVMNTVSEIKARTPLIQELVDAGKMKVVGGYYDLSSGEVQFYE